MKVLNVGVVKLIGIVESGGTHVHKSMTIQKFGYLEV
jgi:hypothetical protein